MKERGVCGGVQFVAIKREARMQEEKDNAESDMEVRDSVICNSTTP